MLSLARSKDSSLDSSLNSSLDSSPSQMRQKKRQRERQREGQRERQREAIAPIAIFPDGSVSWDAPQDSPFVQSLSEPEMIQPEILALQPEFTPAVLSGFSSRQAALDYRVTITVPCAEL
jgi:hypothetical protein